jgi:hypothetical protein
MFSCTSNMNFLDSPKTIYAGHKTVSTRDIRMVFYELKHNIYLNNLQRQVGHGIVAQFLGWISDPHMGAARRLNPSTYD